MRSLLKNILLLLSFLFLCNIGVKAQQKLSGLQTDSIITKGKSEIVNKEWGDALDTFGDLLDHDPGNLYANYYYGIAQRETAISRNPIERIVRFNSADNHFQKVIDTDSTFKDIFYQLAVLQFYKNNYFEAARLAECQIKINDTLESASTGIFHLYDIMLENESKSNVEKYLKSDGSVYSKYFLGEYYRRTDSLLKAESVFRNIISTHPQMSLIPVYLSQVRLYVQENKFEEADQTYMKALKNVFTRIDADLLLKDFEFILNERQYKILYSPISINGIKNSLRIFWQEKNPLPSLPYNMRLIEHYKRLIYAEKSYRYDGTRLKIYDANELARIKHPPWYYFNEKFNDRGIIYLRYGEPDDKMVTLIPGGSAESYMSWLYYQTNIHPRMVFYFMQARFAPPGYWTLVPMMLNPDVLSDLTVWDSRYYYVTPGYRDTWFQLENEGVKTAETGMSTDAFRWPKEVEPLNANFVVNQFREDKNSNLLALDYSIPVSELTAKQDRNDSSIWTVEVSIFDSTMTLVTKKKNNFNLSNINKHLYNNQFINGDRLILPKRKYFISMDIRDQNMSKLFGSYFDYNLTDFDSSLSSSSLELAYKINHDSTTELNNRNDLFILPNPSLKFNKQESFYTYYEIYNLTLDKNKQTSYSIDFSLHIKDDSKSFWNFFTNIFTKKKNYNISIQNNYTDTTQNVSNYIAFDTDELKPGNYEMKLKIKDNVSGKETSASAELVLND